MAVFIWRATGLAIDALFRWPKQIIGAVIILMAIGGLAAGLNALATATGLGNVFYVLLGVTGGRDRVTDPKFA